MQQFAGSTTGNNADGNTFLGMQGKVGGVFLVQGQGKAGLGARGDLRKGIHQAAVILAVKRNTGDENTVIKPLKCFIIHNINSY